MSISLEKLWELNDFKPNDNQRAAILHTDGPLYLPAGPGSGKTRVLLWRTLNLIVFHDVKPEEIYLSTFTEKAAHQLVEGIRMLLAHATNLNGKPYDISRMYVGTIHSLCNRIITDRRFASNKKRHQRPSLLDDIEQYFYLSRGQRWERLTGELNWGENLEEINTAINEYFRKKSSSRHHAVVNCMALFNRFSEECIEPQKAIGKVEDEKLIALLGMYERYLKALEKDEAAPRTDFSLMQQAAYKILEESEGSENAFRHVIIDEYQDTNPIQEKLIFKLGAGSKNVCVVGDDDQALYRFRGATVENFVNFPEKCIQHFGVEPNLIPLDINYRSRRPIVDFYMDFMDRTEWQREDNPHELYRVFKNIQAKREEPGPAVVASTPGPTEDVCREIAQLVKRLLDSKKVENANQIAFLFPSLKVEKVQTMREELERLGLKVYAPRAGSFLKVEESVAVFGVTMQIFGKVQRGEYAGHEYMEYMDWADQAWAKGEALVQADPLLKQFVKDTKTEIEAAKEDYQWLTGYIERRHWKLEQPYEIPLMKRELHDLPGLSKRAQRNIAHRYFDKVVAEREARGRPITLGYLVARATSLDWTLLDLFYRLGAFEHFKQMYDLAEDGGDEGPICNLSLISKYLAQFMDVYRPVISADVLVENKYASWLFNAYLFALYRLGESEYEDPDDPFPKGRIPFLTIHQAKGLEFPVVVLGNPRKSLRGVQEVEKIVHPLIERAGEPLDKMPTFDMMRLFYVALSRAKNLLVIPHWQSRSNYPSEPIRSMLNADEMVRIPGLDLETIPDAKLEKEDLPKNYSYSSDFLGYQKCPRQYMIYNKYDFAPSRSQTMFFGQLVHQTLEDLHQHLIQEKGGQ